jgi:GLPGLI family protein
MKPTLIILICFLMLSGRFALAQNTHFTTDGVIEFDKTVNMYALIKKSINKDNEAWYGPAFESYKKNQPQFKTLKSTLTFSKDKTLFTPIEPETVSNGFFGNDPMAGQNNTIYTDLAINSSVIQKKVFEETFLVKDTTRKIKWKITDETRDIIGYKCRRANAIILDSIYVVAFYTDEIPVSGGPESFTGLPGMILGVALPHENVTWFATKLSEVAVTAKTIVPPKKGKPVNNKGLHDILLDVMKDWGTYAKAYLKAFSL